MVHTRVCVTRRVQLSPPTIPYDGVHHLLRPRPKKIKKPLPKSAVVALLELAYKIYARWVSLSRTKRRWLAYI